MVLDSLFTAYLSASPACVLTRAILERALSGPRLDALFDQVARFQYTRDLYFSTVVDLMGRVVFRQERTVGAAIRKLRSQGLLSVSDPAVYDKINRLEPDVSAAVVRFSAQQLAPVIRELAPPRPSLIPGLRLRVFDGNHIGATEHRLGVLRGAQEAPLPAEVVAGYEPDLDLVTDIFISEDAHAQERSLLPEVLKTVQPNDLIEADRNFCTKDFLGGIARRGAFFLVRQHQANAPGKLVGHRRYCGRAATGAVYEQQYRMEGDDKRRWLFRRITIILDMPTRDGESEIHLLTNVPKTRATALCLAEGYRIRWTIEGMFQSVTVALRCEVKTLAYPRAAAFAFCTAVMAYHVLALERAAVRAVQGEKAEEMLSDYYLAEDIAGTMRGMMIALPPEKWEPFHTCTAAEFADFLRTAAQQMRPVLYKKTPRGPKRPPPKRRSVANGSHVATKRLLDAKRRAVKSP